MKGPVGGPAARPVPAPRPFGELVRDALLHLYDGPHLQTHPLARLVAGATGGARGRTLLRELLDAIEQLRPAGGAPSDARAWRGYRLLELRYVRALPAAEVAGQLALSKTQYRRDHALALEAVASVLRDRWPAAVGGRDEEAGSAELLAVSEAEHVAAHLRAEHVDPAGMLADLLALLAPATAESGIELRPALAPGLPSVYGDRVALRQVFLGLLSVGIEHAAGGTLEVELRLDGGAVVARLSAVGGPDAARPGAADGAELGVARRLVGAMGGGLDAGPGPGGRWGARVSLPIARRPLLLVLDNHPDFVALVGRYLAEHDWRVAGAHDVAQARALVTELRPQAVLLDVMMPGQDGWDLLLALKAEPATRTIPVVVCSVLHEPQVARALGAAGYLRKPITQGALLEALAPLRPARDAPAPPT
jgi:CheY-like chemotaxis protein